MVPSVFILKTEYLFYDKVANTVTPDIKCPDRPFIDFFQFLNSATAIVFLYNDRKNGSHKYQSQ